MRYFEDFQLLNITHVRMYGAMPLQLIDTCCHYLGLMQGQVCSGDKVQKQPFIYFTPCGIRTLNGWRSPEGCWRDNFYLECAGERADRLFAAFGASERCQYYPVSSAEPFMVRFNNLQRLFKQKSPLNNRWCVLQVEEIAALLEEEIVRQKSSGAGRYNIAECIRLISSQPANDWDLQQLARRSGITLRHWTRLFVEASGMSPHRFIAQCRIRLAKELLSNGELPIKAAAVECGWENASDFCRFFRRQTGLTPGEFRRRQLH